MGKVPLEMGEKKQQTESSICGPKEKEETSVDFFSSFGFRVKERFRKKQHNTKKCIEKKHEIYYTNECVETESGIFLLPDDILELCLDRLPLEGLKNARLVCKKWSSFITIARLLQIKDCRYQNLWLFVFGALIQPFCYDAHVSMIHALDLSRNQWHSIDADFLKGRSMFSVASIHDGIIIAGGKSYFGHVVGSIKELNEVKFFNAVTKTWHNMPSMKYSRSYPLLGVIEDSIIPYNKYSSFRRMAIACKFIRQRKSDHSTTSSNFITRSFLLIAIGRTKNESLYRGEIYDSLTNKWTDIQSLPLDFGGVCSGTVCKSKFYVCTRNEKIAAYDIERGFWIAIQTSPPLPFHVYANPYHPHLVSFNGRLFVISSCFWNEQHSMVRKLFELDLMDHTWTEISVQPDAVTNGKNEVFVADEKNLIFGIETFQGEGQITDNFTVCDLSKSNDVNWNNISMKNIDPRPDVKPMWIRSMAVVHVST